MAIRISNLEAFRVLEIKPKNGNWAMVDPDQFIGPATVRVDTGLLSQINVTLQDEGVLADMEFGGIEYPRMDPNNIGTMRCRLSFGYVRMPGSSRQFHEGFLKELRPQFPAAKPPRVELVFQGAGWEFTRVRRKHTYPHISDKFVPEEEQRRKDTTYDSDPNDRSWAERTEVVSTISLETIIRRIIESYGYQVEIRLPDSIDISGESPLKQSRETDWQFIRRLGGEYGFGIYADVVQDTVGDSDEPTSIYKWFITPEAEITGAQEKLNVEFWYHRVKGEKVTEYDPSSKSKFVIIDEPDITINSNWAFQPQLVMDTNEEGDEVYRLTEVDENNQVIIYEINQDMLNTDEADQYAADYIQGKAGWEEARKFFRRKAIEHHGVEHKGQQRAVFQGIEMNFQTLGNPLAEIGMRYPIKGLGRFYSRNMKLMGVTHTVDHTWKTSYEFKMV